MNKRSGRQDGDRAGRSSLAALAERPPSVVFQPRLRLRRRTSIVLLSLLSVVVLAVAFAPFDLWYLAYIALVPWAMSITPGGMHHRCQVLCGWLAGVLFWAASVHWLSWITPGGYIAATLYLSVYWLIATLIVRGAMRRGWPMWVVLPVVWTTMEFLWSTLPVMDEISFPWFLLAHTQYARTHVIQIADVTGAYGVSFFVAMVNGAVVDLLISPLFVRCRNGRTTFRRRIVAGAAVSAIIGAAMVLYGTWRLGQETTSPGPRIGIVQRAVPISLEMPDVPRDESFEAHMRMSELFVGARCDLVVWPETMLPHGMNDEWPPVLKPEPQEELLAFRRRIGDLSDRLGCPVLAGGAALYLNRRFDPAIDPPYEQIRRHNSALLFDGGSSPVWQYDKMHLVPVSEYVPFRDSWEGLFRAIRGLVPDSMPQIEPGRMKPPAVIGRSSRQWNLVSPICFEGTVPDVCRRLVVRRGKKLPDCVMINLSNDGWFVYQRYDNVLDGQVVSATAAAPPETQNVRFEGREDQLRDIQIGQRLMLHDDGPFVGHLKVTKVRGAVLEGLAEPVRSDRPIAAGDRLAVSVRTYHTTEQTQHMVQYCFRAVENRVPVVRAVNTGISGLIDSNGRIVSMIERDGRRTMVVGAMLLGPTSAPAPRQVSLQSGGEVLVDRRVSVYSLVGDVFAWIACGGAVALAAGLIILRVLARKEKRN